MEAPNLTGAIAALMDEYKKAVDELITVIIPVGQRQLTKTIEPKSSDPDCISIQTILTHVVASMFSYAVYIENSIGLKTVRPERFQFDHISPYILKLREALKYNVDFFTRNPDITLEEFDQSKKINTMWGQQYDVEQMLEHAIVHILRHRRQIENALIKMEAEE
ncbi:MULTISPECIES: DinB family protein [Chryseobacterium]|uniref:Damage-inducible protein DinB n=1 Tax=Chryseobacterium camelliae TaxID=1265445 RepID=A0ABU0TE60_9FLAO|nr:MULTISPECIES: DinB family protein [Chryseobacterium]MDT3406839.1 putative damage-inducible protein DinB [Pseudacidovorax intermedius]MDQ1095365.1 putative damage-inducible protein DinB [Chryseobacterium camelliae]MDQ1099303.1 putative damage-inducible protein DinB [Chryseobacterium sp. SORGH_AS_1048]MDR6086652.1 putative damage-inducible protein DinB [Chryseobacterium sp. SORGH_AS_0909]MDR6131024.1 putative damage-inducible protein DinB [Chryseobacterium sp. SORGH_AS_1175]